MKPPGCDNAPMQWSKALSSKVMAWRRRHAAPIGVAAVTTVALLALACGSDGDEPGAQAVAEQAAPAQAAAEQAVAEQAAAEPEPPEQAAAETQAAAESQPPPEDRAEAQAETQAQAEATAAATAEDEPASEPPPPASAPFLPLDADRTPAGEPILRDLGAPRHFGRGWNTNFDISLVEYEEILSGGVLRDGIPAIRDPRFISIAEADTVYADQIPVVQFGLNGDVRAYPLEILTWHEIVADVVGGVPVAVTFCPLCNTAITFDRTIGGTVYDFGVSGVLRNSDLIMYDSQTESLWQQIGGVAIVGDMVGARLTVLPSTIVAWGDFKAQYPEGIVLSRETGYARRYGANPYVGYDRIGNTPFLFRGEVDPRLSAMERVVTLDLPGDAVAYPFTLLAERRAVADVRDGRPIVVFWTPGVTSALDGADIARSRDVGATGVFERSVDGRPLDFRPNPDDPATFLDAQTQSVWNIFGVARSGPLAGAQLTPVVHANHFWFAWAAFQPDTVVFGG